MEEFAGTLGNVGKGGVAAATSALLAVATSAGPAAAQGVSAVEQPGEGRSAQASAGAASISEGHGSGAAAPGPASQRPSPPGEPTPDDPSVCEAPSTERVEEAKARYREGQRALLEADYGHAIHLWQLAYRLDCTAHAILLNLATAFELQGDLQSSVGALLAYDRQVPDSPYAAANALRRERLSARVAARLEAERPTSPAPKTKPPPPEFDYRTAALGAAAAGGLFAVLGGVMYLDARASAGSAEADCEAGRADCQDAEAALAGEGARARARAAGWVSTLGLTVGLSALGLHQWLGWKEGEATLQLAASPDSGWIRWRAAF